MREQPDPDGPGAAREPHQPWNQEEFLSSLREHEVQGRAVKDLEKDVADALEPLIIIGDTQSSVLMDEVSKMMLEHDRGTIDDQRYMDNLRAFRERLKGRE